MDKVQIDNLAEKIAQVIAGESRPTELSSLQMSIEALNARLDKIEQMSKPQTSSLPVHPGHERFNIAEAIADAVFGNLENDKTCSFEPHNKPCDSCSMCSSRGF